MCDNVDPQVLNMFNCLILYLFIAACSWYMISCSTRLQRSLLTISMYNELLYSLQQYQPKQSNFLLKESMLQPNLHPFLYQIFKVLLISKPMGYVASPMVVQPLSY